MSEQSFGPVQDEVVRLLGSVQQWARANFPEAAPGPDGHTGADCQWCPLCQFMAVLRGDRPELTERVAEAGAALTAAVKALVEATATGAAASGSASTGSSSSAGSGAPHTPRVQRIDLGDPGDAGDEA